ncbi:tRNA lysidine(34) synthetase TilS [Devosia algicola]|uniref:tRNA(Ile)-lysidine synthase n=1 Tax=Devosia algicola TaxID=3026418 RepID=A0ABY7YIR0_9HYPH|nr:tRNA lysidine(34) synthetase TilS [Devosia algicola]WDR01158.1 tRNA lysidine(34) synthetase TilS [Devosia algicola]
MSARLTFGDEVATLGQLFGPVAAFSSLGLAVSGGADSLALMVLAHRWAAQQGRGVRLVVYSVDHGLRPEAAAEVAMVLACANAMGLEGRGLVWPAPHPKSGVQEAARNARYGLIKSAMKEDGVEVLLTAHHQQDQAETVLMRLAHGSGVAGLAGMTPFSNVGGVKIFRPLLCVDPADLGEVVSMADLTPAQDPSNEDSHYERVRWRKLMPQLAALGLDGNRLGDFAQRMGRAREALEVAAESALGSLVTSRTSEEAVIVREGFTQLPQSVAVLMLSTLLAEMGTGKKSRALGTVEALYQVLVSEQEFSGRTLHGCMVRRRADSIIVRTETGRRGKLLSHLAVEPNKS